MLKTQKITTYFINLLEKLSLFIVPNNKRDTVDDMLANSVFAESIQEQLSWKFEALQYAFSLRFSNEYRVTDTTTISPPRLTSTHDNSAEVALASKRVYATLLIIPISLITAFVLSASFLSMFSRYALRSGSGEPIVHSLNFCNATSLANQTTLTNAHCEEKNLNIQLQDIQAQKALPKPEITESNLTEYRPSHIVATGELHEGLWQIQILDHEEIKSAKAERICLTVPKVKTLPNGNITIVEQANCMLLDFSDDTKHYSSGP